MSLKLSSLERGYLPTNQLFHITGMASAYVNTVDTFGENAANPPARSPSANSEAGMIYLGAVVLVSLVNRGRLACRKTRFEAVMSSIEGTL